MSTEKKAPVEKAEESLEFEKLTENEEGQLAGGFSDALQNEDESDSGDINIFKCHCSTSPSES